MLGKPTLTDKIISFLGDVSDGIEYPKSFGQMINWDRHEYYKQKERNKAQIKRERRRVKQALWRLEKAEVVTFDNKMKEYQLTPKGWIKFLYYYNKKSRKGDKTKEMGKYLIIFDIPEEYAHFRNLFRKCLKNTGCRLIQKSVWLTGDKNVFIFAKKIVSNCELEDYVKFVEAKEIS